MKISWVIYNKMEFIILLQISYWLVCFVRQQGLSERGQNSGPDLNIYSRF